MRYFGSNNEGIEESLVKNEMSWVEVGGGEWSWVEVVAQFRNTHISIDFNCQNQNFLMGNSILSVSLQLI